jgi:hypothetical protein
LRALVGEIRVLEGGGLAGVAGFIVKGLVVGVLQEAALDLVDVDLIGRHVANREKRLVQIHLKVQQLAQLPGTHTLPVQLPLRHCGHARLNADFPVLYGYGDILFPL